MREKHLHKLIRESSSNDNKALADKLKKRHPEIICDAVTKKETQSHMPQKSIKKRIAIFAPLATMLIVAVVLIPTLLLSTDNTPDNDSNFGRPTREYVTEKLDCTIQEYNDLNDTAFLFFSWTDVSNYSITQFNHINTKAFWGLNINLSNAETNDKIEYTICSSEQPLDFLEYNISICTEVYTVFDYSVKWSSINGNAYGIFNYCDYDYYITLKNNPDESRLFELIEILLLSQT